jgi:hypothetical protein
MQQPDYAELMRYTQARLRGAGMEEVLDRITVDIGTEQAPPSLQVLRMVERLDGELRREAAGTVDQILQELATTTRTAEGGPPDRLWLELTPAHRDLYGIDGVDLHDGLPLAAALREIEELHRELIDDLEERDGPGA